MDRLSHLIPRVLSRRGLKDEAAASYITYLATEWIEDNFPDQFQYLRVAKYEYRKLLVYSANSIASAELSMTSEALLRYLNSHEGISIENIIISRSK